MRKYQIKKLERAKTLTHGESFIEIEEEIKPLTTNLETGEVLNPTKYTILKKTGEKRDIQDEINSYKEQADINAIIKKVEATGDTTLLNKKLGVYEDISQAPDNLADAYKQAAELQTRIDQAQKLLAELQEQKGATENGNGTNNGDSSLDSSSNNTNSNNS